ncbi:hypothetical protein [Microcystis phage Mel-JY01]
MKRWIKITDDPATWPPINRTCFFTIKRWWEVIGSNKIYMTQALVVNGRESILLDRYNIIPTHYYVLE